MYCRWSSRIARFGFTQVWKDTSSSTKTGMSIAVATLIATQACTDEHENCPLDMHMRQMMVSPTSTEKTLCEEKTEGFASAVLGRLSNIRRRHNTFKVMEDMAERDTLEARFKVDWRNPIGEGTFGSVYRGSDRKTGENVAVKKISKRATDDVSFQREMEALVHIRKHGGHPHICGMRANYDQGDYYYIVLDLISGGEMFDHLANHGAYSEADAARLIREVASALAFIHGLNCVHGDLKPENRTFFVQSSVSFAFTLSSNYPSHNFTFSHVIFGEIISCSRKTC
jgi:hypothetical protein